VDIITLSSIVFAHPPIQSDVSSSGGRATPHPCAIRPAPRASSPSLLTTADLCSIGSRPTVMPSGPVPSVEEFFSGAEWNRCDEQECALIAERNEDFTEVDPWADQVEELLNSRQETGVWPVKIPRDPRRPCCPARTAGQPRCKAGETDR